jgi:hypothetical protein
MPSWVIPARDTTKDLEIDITFRIRNGPKPSNIHRLRQKRKTKNALHVCVCIGSRITGLWNPSPTDEDAGVQVQCWTSTMTLNALRSDVNVRPSGTQPIMEARAYDRRWFTMEFSSPHNKP